MAASDGKPIPGRSTAWTPEEDDMLRSLVDKYGCKKWALIASKMQVKGSKQCRRRWQNYLNAEVKQGGWSTEEDELLLEGHRKVGNRWTEIAKMVQGRTDNAVKNRFAVLIKKQAKPDKNRGKKRARVDRDGEGAVQTPPQGFDRATPGASRSGRDDKRQKLPLPVAKKQSAAAQVAPGLALPPPIRLAPAGTDELGFPPDTNTLLGASDLCEFLLSSARAGSDNRPGTPLDTPVADMSSVFSWFLGGGSPRTGVDTPTSDGATVAEAAAALFRDAGVPSLSNTPVLGSGGKGKGKEAEGLTAEQGRKALLQRLLTGNAHTLGGGRDGGGQSPMAGLLNLFAGGGDHSPLGGGPRRSPRLAPIRTGAGAGPSGAAAAAAGGSATAAGLSGSLTPADKLRLAEFLQSPSFSAVEMQLLLATLEGENPFAPGSQLSTELGELLSGALSPDAGGTRRSPRFAGGGSARAGAAAAHF